MQNSSASKVSRRGEREEEERRKRRGEELAANLGVSHLETIVMSRP